MAGVEVKGLSASVKRVKPINATTVKRFKTINVTIGMATVTSPGYTPPAYEGEYNVTPTKEAQRLNTDGFLLKDNVTVDPIPDEYIVPEGTKKIVSNGEHDVNSFEKVNVDVPNEIPDGYIKPEGERQISSNGSYDVKEYATAEVNVPIPDGYIKPAGAVTITNNGNHDVTKYQTALVVVPAPDGYLKPSGIKQITSNGTHDVKQYESAEVNVPIPEGYIKPSGTKQITSNGEHDVNSYQKVNVNVSDEIPDGYYDASGIDTDPSKVLDGEDFINESGKQVGAMPNNGAVNATIQGLVNGMSTPQPYTIPEGYHNGQGKVQISSDVKTLHDGIAAAIRSKGQVVSLNYDPLAFPDHIRAIETGITPSGTLDIASNGTHDVTQYASVNVNVQLPEAEYKEVTPTKEFQHITPSNGKILDAVGVNPIPDEYIIPSGEKEITANGTHDVTNYASVIVNVAGGGGGEPDPRDDYQRVEYITSAEEETYPYIVTDFIADNTCGVEVVASFPIMHDRIPMGSRVDTGSTRFYCVYPLSTSSVYYGFNTGSSISCSTKVNTIYRLQTNFLNSRLVCVYEEDGTRKANASINATLTQQTVPVAIFGYNYASSDAVTSKREYKLYSARCSKGHEIVREYIPCYRKSDGVVGLFEKCTGTFLTSETGSFAKGADIDW